MLGYDPAALTESPTLVNHLLTLMMYHFRVRLSHRTGFTLLELSIVLVIFGLIVGGILVGKDLIEAAQLRKIISMREQFDIAVNTFRGKYGCLPGDCDKAEQFGLTDPPGCTVGCGDGNGRYTWAGSTSVLIQFQSGEPVLMWKHLGEAGLFPAIAGAFNANGTLTGGALSDYFPQAPDGRFMLIGTQFDALGIPAGAVLYFMKLVTLGASYPTAVSSFTPLEAFAIDSKADDGGPWTGHIIATESIMAYFGFPDPFDLDQAFNMALAGTPSEPTCAYTDGSSFDDPASGKTATYNAGGSQANVDLCELAMHSDFLY